MFRCSPLLLLFIFALSLLANHAQAQQTQKRPSNNRGVAQLAEPAEAPAPKSKAQKVITLGYASWVEKLGIDQAAVSDTAWATFSGTTLGIEFEEFKGRNSITTEFALLSGQATGGGTSQFITYVSPRMSYWGGKAALKTQYRQTAQIAFGAGLNVLYRQIKWQTDQVDMKLASGSEFNFAFLAEMKIRLTPSWELRQEIGAVAFNATTYWMVGAGYRF